MSARRRLRFRKVSFHLGAVALIALAAQFIAVYAPLGDDDTPRRVLFVFSYVLLLAFTVLNVGVPGIAIIGLGLLLNAIPILANGGLMPITPETVLKSGDLPGDAEIGQWLPYSKDVLLEREDVHLYFLSDRLVTNELSPVIRAFSIGDIVIAAGLAATVFDLFVPRLDRLPDSTLSRSADNRQPGNEGRW